MKSKPNITQLMGNSEVPKAVGAPRESKAAFTRLDLLAVLVALTVLAALALPVLAATTANSQIAQCLNNLRQMGRAVHVWGTEHQYNPPWRTFMSDGGTLPNTGSKPGNAWLEFSYLSNELATPRILGCPSDSGVLIARDFGEYISPGFRALATSYFLNLHTTAAEPATAITGDRNLRFSGPQGTCPYAGNTSSFSPITDGWTNAVHGLRGNIVLMDGDVAETTSGQLRAVMQKSSINGSVHLLRAR